MATFRPSGVSVFIRESLVAGSSRSGTTLNVDPIITKDGHRVAMSDIGDIGYGKINPGKSTEEIISFTGITDNTATMQLTGVVWGYDFYRNTGSVAANQKKHISGEIFIITNDDHWLTTQFVNIDDSQTIAGAKTFSTTPVNTGGNPTASNELSNKAYVDLTATGSANFDQNLVSGVGGEIVVAGDSLYLKEADGKWWKTDASLSATAENVIVGIAQGAGIADGAITNGVLIGGIDKNATYTAGAKYYLSDTAGALSTTAGTIEVLVGTGDANNNLVFEHNATLETLTAGEKDALAGTSGTPSSSNKFVTEDDVEDDGIDQSQTTQDGTAAVGEADTTTKYNEIAQSFIADKTSITGVKLYKSADTDCLTWKTAHHGVHHVKPHHEIL